MSVLLHLQSEKLVVGANSFIYLFKKIKIMEDFVFNNGSLKEAKELSRRQIEVAESMDCHMDKVVLAACLNIGFCLNDIQKAARESGRHTYAKEDAIALLDDCREFILMNISSDY